MTVFGKRLSEYVAFSMPFLGLILVVGIARLALSLGGVSSSIATWLSITAVMWIGVLYYSIRVHTSGFGSYKHLLPICVLQSFVAQAIAGIALEVPEDRELPQRLDAVLEAIYAAYGSGWEDAAGADPRGRGLADEAIWLARVLVQRLPTEPEARGLLALILHCESRRQARRAADGRYIPLSEQHTGQWSKAMIGEAERELAAAAQQARPGRFQLEAAIQSVHAERARSGRTDWRAITLFYGHLVQLAPTLGARIGRAAALAEVQGPEAGLDQLSTLLGGSCPFLTEAGKARSS